MSYLNQNLSIKGLHAELENVRLSNIWGVLIFEVNDEVYNIEPCPFGLCLTDELGKNIAISSLADYDYADNNKQALDYMLNDLYDQIIGIESTLLYGV